MTTFSHFLSLCLLPLGIEKNKHLEMKVLSTTSRRCSSRMTQSVCQGSRKLCGCWEKHLQPSRVNKASFCLSTLIIKTHSTTQFLSHVADQVILSKFSQSRQTVRGLGILDTISTNWKQGKLTRKADSPEIKWTPPSNKRQADHKNTTA